MFGHDVDHEPTHKLKAGLSNFFVFVPEVWPKQRSEKLQKKRPKLVLKNKNQNRLAFSFFAHAVQIWGYNFRSKTVKLSGASQKCHLPHSSTKTPGLPGMYGIEFLYWSKNFWWVANWAMKPSSMYLSLRHRLYQVSPWSGTTTFIRI